MSEYGLFSKEVALNLDINPNTLRRWSLELEKEGYEFTRNDKDQRIYYDRDMLVLTDFQKMIEKTQSLENAAKAVVKRAQDKKNAEKMLSVIVQEDDKMAFTKEELEELLKKTAEETAARTAEHLLQKFNDSLEQRDRQLMQGIRQTFEEKQEQQRQLLLETAATQEKQPFWARWFGKKEKAKDQI